MNYQLKKYATDQVNAENDATILHYVQPFNMTPQQNADGLIAKSWKVADVYDERTLSDVFIESIDASIRHNLRNYWARNSQTFLSDIAFQEESLLSI